MNREEAKSDGTSSLEKLYQKMRKCVSSSAECVWTNKVIKQKINEEMPQNAWLKKVHLNLDLQ